MEAGDVSAGSFGSWLQGMWAALAGTADAEVPCGTCTACCRSAQFVHVGPDETAALAHIPRALLFPAPRLPKGHMVMGYDRDGRCPMLVGDGCSIYEHRPRTCRTYDCRVFPATGVAVDDDKPAIAEQAGWWRFDHPEPQDEALHEACRAAAAYLAEHPDGFPGGRGPATNTQLAVAAIERVRVTLRARPPRSNS